jgi:hypothetical protein
MKTNRNNLMTDKMNKTNIIASDSTHWTTESLFEAFSMLANKDLMMEAKYSLIPDSENNTVKILVSAYPAFHSSYYYEYFTPEDVPLIEQAAEDLKSIGEFCDAYTFELWMARKSGFLPLQSWLDEQKISLRPDLMHLFAAAVIKK